MNGLSSRSMVEHDEVPYRYGLGGIDSAEDTPAQCSDHITKYEWVMITLAIITTAWMVLTIYVTVKFFVNFKFRKGLFSFFLVLLNFALWGRLTFIGSEIVLNRPSHWGHRKHWAEGLVSYSGSFFLSIAGLLNIYNWLYFTLSIKTIFESRKQFKLKVKKWINWLFLPSVLFIVLSFSVGFTWSWLIPDTEKGKPDKDEDNKIVVQYFSVLTWTIYILLGIGFALAGMFLLKEVTLRNEEAGSRMK